jgi:hypothetical protein
MSPFAVDPEWYGKYWLTEQPRRKRQPLRANMARLAVVVVLLAGSGVVLNHLHVGSGPTMTMKRALTPAIPE